MASSTRSGLCDLKLTTGAPKLRPWLLPPSKLLPGCELCASCPPCLQCHKLLKGRVASMALLCICRVSACFIRRMSPKSDAGVLRFSHVLVRIVDCRGRPAFLASAVA